jgi:hypothetical protein
VVLVEPRPNILFNFDGNRQLLSTPLLGRFELYHLPDDPGQSRNLAASHPDLVRRLERQMEAWNQALAGYADRPCAEIGKGRHDADNAWEDKP